MVDARKDNSDVISASTWGQRLNEAAQSLQCKATSLVVILTLSVTAIVSGYLLKSTEELAQSEHDAQLLQLAGVLSNAASIALAREDYDAVAALASDAVSGGSLLYLAVSDAQGQPLAAAEREDIHILHQLDRVSAKEESVPGRPVLRRITGDVPVFLDVIYPITSRRSVDTASARVEAPERPQLLGYVRIGMAADQWHRAMSSRLDLMFGVGVLAAVVAIPLGFLLIRRIVSPVDDLANAMHRFSHGDLDVRSTCKRSDELGRLAVAFNKMADQHQQTDQRILGLNVELEERVAQRTQQLQELASRDPLTGLYNRRYFNEMLDRRLSEALRYGGDLSCVMIDLDEFKDVNDLHGHHVGDEILNLAATTITGQLRSADVAARFGGDEFIILLPRTESDRAVILADRIAARFESNVAARLPDVEVTMSMGIASVSSPSIEDAESLIRAADRSLYDAKATGKNRIIAMEMARTVST